ncbi:MAG: CvpA family protein [Pirellulales bacterium]|nr:CvpA family protein [Pirellulales bacterium]
MFTVLMFVVLFACVACLYTEGIWGNALRLINVVTSALLAMNFYEPVADMLDGWGPSYTYFWDFLALWGVFGVCMVVFRLATDRLSRVKVRFLKIADQIGSAVLAIWIGWVMVCFTATTMHTAPLARNPLWGSFNPEQRMFFGLAPDRQWLAFTQKISRGSFARSASESQRKQEKYVFDPKGEFMLKYATRRAKAETSIETSGTMRVR